MSTIGLGESIPVFRVQDQDGNWHTDAEYRNKKNIFFFYPKASTPGCTAEACSLQEGYHALKNLGYSLVGVSADAVEKQKKFQEKYGFTYPLLADVDKVIINGFGAWGPKKFMGKSYEGILRLTFITDDTGHITHVIDKVKTKEHAEQVLALLK